MKTIRTKIKLIVTGTVQQCGAQIDSVGSQIWLDHHNY
jgi:hypothetical protein